MTPERHRQIGELFHAALAVAVEECPALLDAACRGDPDLRREVESLLIAHTHARSFIAAPALDAAGSPLTQTADPVSVGHRIAHYEILARLGTGGMGVVYLVEDTRLGRRAALKLLARDHDQEQVRRFEQEARAASALNHPNIVTVYDVGVADEGHFIALEFVAGRTLRELLDDSPLLALLPHAGAQVARALSVAHAAGIVHRDVKPENVIVRDDGYVKVLDFGLARLLPQAETTESLSTQTEQLMGTARYMSPEQARGERVGPPSDVFSLGIILYEMATGLHPFAADSFLGTLHAIIAETPPPPSRSNPEIATSLDSLILAMLDKDAARRLTASDVEAALTGVSVPAARPPLIPTRLRRPLYGIAVVVALLAVGVSLWQRRPQAPPLTDKDVLVLADFINSTGDPVFDGTLREALAVHLDRSPFLNVMNDAQVRQILRLMGRAPGERITNETAREVCLRGREKAMIGGSIAGLGTSYAIILHATNCATGETLAREQVEAKEKEQVLTAVGVAARGMRTKLGESLGSIQALERHSALSATTPSLDAFQAYARGLLQFRRGLWLQAVPFLQRATELDPEFAMAFQVLSHAYWNAGERRRSVEYSREAFALIDRVSERERLAISAIYYIRVTGEAEKITDALELFQQTFPRISIPRDFRGGFYYSMGEFEKAAQEFEEAVRLDSRGWIPYVNLIRSYAALDQFDKARAVAENAFAQKLDAPGLHQLVLRIALMRGDGPAARKEIQWFLGGNDEYLSLDEQASNAIVLGQRRKAGELLMRAADLARRRHLTAPAKVLTEAAAADPFGECQSEDDLVTSLRACLDIHAALRDAEANLKERPADTLLIAVHLPMRRAAIELKRNQPKKAIELLKAAAPYDRRYPEVVYLRGLAYLRAAKAAEAAREFRRIIEHKGPSWGPRYPLAHLGLARATAQLGDAPGASKAYEDFLTLWKDGDPDIPDLVEAKKEYARLNEASRP